MTSQVFVFFLFVHVLFSRENVYSLENGDRGNDMIKKRLRFSKYLID